VLWVGARRNALSLHFPDDELAAARFCDSEIADKPLQGRRAVLSSALGCRSDPLRSCAKLTPACISADQKKWHTLSLGHYESMGWANHRHAGAKDFDIR
jgi:hypothetical protein